MVFNLPCGNALVVHLKDKSKIRIKKRWSQVLYMYYLLGFKNFEDLETMERFYSQTHAEDANSLRQDHSRKNQNSFIGFGTLLRNIDAKLRSKLENTFILTLDGDVEFRPKAVHLMVDKMREDNQIGSVCGRVHPIGSGPIVWYQVFEYAVGHWLQKVSEHCFGTVMCSPGCFSLLRGSVLLEDQVLGTFIIYLN